MSPDEYLAVSQSTVAALPAVERAAVLAAAVRFRNLVRSGGVAAEIAFVLVSAEWLVGVAGGVASGGARVVVLVE